MDDSGPPSSSSAWQRAVDRLRAHRVQPEGKDGGTWKGALRAALRRAGGRQQASWQLELSSTLLNDLPREEHVADQHTASHPAKHTHETAQATQPRPGGRHSASAPPDTATLARAATRLASGSDEGRLLAFSEVVAVGSTFVASVYDRRYRPKYRTRRDIAKIRAELEALNSELFGSGPPCGLPGLRPLQSRALQLPDHDSDDEY